MYASTVCVPGSGQQKGVGHARMEPGGAPHGTQGRQPTNQALDYRLGSTCSERLEPELRRELGQWQRTQPPSHLEK